MCTGRGRALAKTVKARATRPGTSDAAWAVALKAVNVGKTSFELMTQLKDKSGNVAATVRTVHVAVSKQTAEKIDIPEKIRAGLESIS